MSVSVRPRFLSDPVEKCLTCDASVISRKIQKVCLDRITFSSYSDLVAVGYV